MSSTQNESGLLLGVSWYLKSLGTAGKHHVEPTGLTTNLQASLSLFIVASLCPCCYRNRSHCQKWKDDNHREKKKKLGTQIKIILKALSRILVLLSFYKRDSQKPSTEVKAMLYISGETSNSIFPQLSF